MPAKGLGMCPLPMRFSLRCHWCLLYCSAGTGTVVVLRVLDHGWIRPNTFQQYCTYVDVLYFYDVHLISCIHAMPCHLISSHPISYHPHVMPCYSTYSMSCYAMLCSANARLCPPNQLIRPTTPNSAFSRFLVSHLSIQP